MSEAKVFQVEPIPESFKTLYETAVTESKDKYYHWCGPISENLLPDPAQKELVEGEFQWFGDFTGHLTSQKGGANK